MWGADQAGWMVQKFVNNMCLSMVVEKYFRVKILESPVVGHDLFKLQFWFANLQLGLLVKNISVKLEILFYSWSDIFYYFASKT